FLAAAHADPGGRDTTARTAAVIHLSCPALQFLDKGKTRLRVPEEVAAAIARALWLVTKDLYTEGGRRKKDAARQARADRNREARWEGRKCSLKDAVYLVMAEAFAHATGGGRTRTSARFLYYPSRRLIQEHTAEELSFDYFKQLLTE